jgi:hypothetical protein
MSATTAAGTAEKCPWTLRNPLVKSYTVTKYTTYVVGPNLERVHEWHIPQEPEGSGSLLRVSLERRYHVSNDFELLPSGIHNRFDQGHRRHGVGGPVAKKGNNGARHDIGTTHRLLGFHTAQNVPVYLVLMQRVVERRGRKDKGLRGTDRAQGLDLAVSPAM